MSNKKKYFLRLLFSIAAVLLAFYMGRILFGENGLYELNRLRQELSGLHEENARLEKSNIELYRTINRLKNDPVFIEHVAREELQMISKDEIVFKFQDPLPGNIREDLNTPGIDAPRQESESTGKKSKIKEENLKE